MLRTWRFNHYVRLLTCGLPHQRQTAAAELARIGKKEAIPILISRLSDSEAVCRRDVAAALRALGEPTWAELIKGDVGDFSRLAVSTDRRIASALVHALNHLRPEVRATAAKGLSRIDGASAGKILICALRKETDTHVVDCIADALGKLKEKEAVQPLLEAVDKFYFDCPHRAFAALAKIGDASAVEPLIHWLERRASLTQGHYYATGAEKWELNLPNHWDDVADALSKLGDPRAVEPLLNLLRLFKKAEGKGYRVSYCMRDTVRCIRDLAERLPAQPPPGYTRKAYRLRVHIKDEEWGEPYWIDETLNLQFPEDPEGEDPKPLPE